MIDCQDLFPVQPYLNKREVFGRQPEFTDLLIFPHKVSPLDPERKRLGRVSGDPDNRVILSVDPNIAFEEILVPALGDGLGDQTAVGDRKSTRLNSSHLVISYAVFCLKKKKKNKKICEETN